MMAVEHTGSAHFIDTERVEAPEDAPQANIYPYAYFRSLEHVAFGLYRTAGGPHDEEIDSEQVGSYGMEPLNPYWEFGDALAEIDSKYAFEEVPYVEVISKEEYIEALEALDAPEEDEDGWEGAGLYDFRDSPPSYMGTVEANELKDMERAADDAFEYMFQDDEWEEAYRKLAENDEGDE
jgi:hypothetical protein